MSRDSVPPVPEAANLYQAALNHLARYAATEAGLRKVLMRRIDRWARLQTDAEAAEPSARTARLAVDGVVKRLVEAGAVSDTVFAESRARGLVRAGQSRRSVQLRLVSKGVAPELARSAAETDPETELSVALVLARKRRIGPYRAAEEADAAIRLKELALLARAGFPRDIAERALDTDRDEAESRIFELRR
jgi:regulatory protein